MKKKSRADVPAGRTGGQMKGAAPSRAAAGDRDAGDGLQPIHLLIVAVMVMATAAVLVAHGTRLSNTILIMLAIVAAGVTAVAVYRTLIPLASEVPLAQPEMLGGRTRAALEREKTIVLRAIKELEFDRAMGKVSDADCEEMVGRLRARAVRLIRQLDSGGAGYRELIQRELDARFGRTRVTGPSGPGAQVGANAGGAQ